MKRKLLAITLTLAMLAGLFSVASIPGAAAPTATATDFKTLDDYNAKGIYGINNILKKATITLHNGSIKDTTKKLTLLVDDFISMIHNNTNDPSTYLDAGIDEDNGEYLYYSFALDTFYNVDKFMIAGSGIGKFGAESYDVYAAAYEDITEATTPVYTYNENVTFAQLVEFDEPIKTNVLTVRIECKGSGNNKQTWISEIAACDTQQACVVGATLTALESDADAEIVETLITNSENLLENKTQLDGSGSEAKPTDMYDKEVPDASNYDKLTDGNCQGVNETIYYKLDSDGKFHDTVYAGGNKEYNDGTHTHGDITGCHGCSWVHNMTGVPSSCQYAVSTADDTRYISTVVKEATATSLGWTQMGFDLGATTDIAKLLIAGVAEPLETKLSTLQNTHEKKPTEEIPVTDIKKGTRLHMVDVYISDTADDLYDDGSKVVTMDYLNGNLDELSKSWAPLAGIYDLDEVVTGRYVGFRMYVADNWGWYGLVRFSELGVYAADPQFARTPVDDMGDLPQNNLIAGKEPTGMDGQSVDLDEGPATIMTDGLIQGVNQEVKFDLSNNPEDQIITTKDGDFYSAIAPSELVEMYEGEGAATDQTWYIKPDKSGYLGYVAGQRASLIEDDTTIYYDMGEPKSVESILLASSNEYETMQLSTTKNTELTMDKCEALLSELKVDGRLLHTVKVYVGNDPETLFEGTPVLDYAFPNVSTNPDVKDYSDALRNLWMLPEAVTGQYVGFDFSGCVMKELVRISELGVYGTDVTTYTSDNLTDNIPSKDDNVLTHAVDTYYCANSEATIDEENTTIETDGNRMTTVLVDGMVSQGNGTDVVAQTDSAGYVYFTYDLGTVYDIKRLYYAGNGVDGAGSVAVYVGDYTCEEIAQLESSDDSDFEPDAFHNSDALAVSFDFPRALTGQYVTFRLGTCTSDSREMVWISEFAALGTPATVHTFGAGRRSGLINNSYYVRFGFHMATDNIGYAVGNLDDALERGNFTRETLGLEDTTTHVGSTDTYGYTAPYSEVIVKDFGAVISNKKGIVPSHLMLERCINANRQIKKVSARNLYLVEDKHITFTVGITGIPMGMETRTLYARPYIVYEIDGEEITLYGEMHATTVKKLTPLEGEDAA